MKLLIMAVLLSIFQTPTPVPRETADTAARSSQHIKQKPSAKQSPSIDSPPIRNTQSAKGDENKGEPPSNADTQETIFITESAAVPVKDWWDRASVVFTGLLAAIGGLGVYFAIRTLRGIERQAKANEDTLTEIKAAGEHAGKQAEAALLSAKAIMGSERAWILVKPELPDGLRAAPQNQITRFRWSIKNVGRTPARILETDALAARIEKMKDFPPKPRYVGSPLSMNEFLLVPNDCIPITWMIEGDSLTEDEVAKIRGGVSLHFAAYGYVKYLDVFDKAHTMRFCHRFVVYADTGKEGFEPYTDAPPEYNKCD